MTKDMTIVQHKKQFAEGRVMNYEKKKERFQLKAEPQNKHSQPE